MAFLRALNLFSCVDALILCSTVLVRCKRGKTTDKSAQNHIDSPEVITRTHTSQAHASMCIGS